MDLGFGGSNQKVGSAAANVLLQNIVAQERAQECGKRNESIRLAITGRRRLKRTSLETHPGNARPPE
jgi:hypothetical protein